MDILILIAIILEILAGIMLILSYSGASKGKKFAGIAIIGCILGIAGTGLFLLIPWRVFTTPMLSLLMLIMYVIVIVLTFVWKK